MLLPFAKYHGLGNDFAVIDARQLPTDLRGPLGQRLCDRFTGIGADGLLLWTGTAEKPTMTVVNNDGSVAIMCGNGLRCFVKYLADRHLLQANFLTVQTGAGPLSCQLHRNEQGLTETVEVDMGRGDWQPAAVQLHNSPAGQEPLVLQAIVPGWPDLRFSALSTGNPHAVTFDPLSTADRLALGPQIGALPLFGAGVNVEFATVQQTPSGPRIEVAVHERGCGWTQACGTGATATAMEAARQGLVPFEQPVPVKLPGGWLAITVRPDFSAIMRGPATWVYDGQLDLAAFSAD